MTATQRPSFHPGVVDYSGHGRHRLDYFDYVSDRSSAALLSFSLSSFGSSTLGFGLFKIGNTTLSNACRKITKGE